MGATNRRLGLGLASTSVLVLLLSACTSGTPIPSSSPVVVETTTPSPAPTAAGAQPTLPLECANIFTETAATAIVGLPVKLVATETSLRGGTYSIATLQAGLFDCVWGGTGRTDNGWDDYVEIKALPDAASDYDTGVMKVDDGAVVYTAGTHSEYLCGVYETYSACHANLLIDNYWVHAEIWATGSSSGMTASSAEAGARAVLDRMAALVPATSPRPAWMTPSGALTGAYCPTSDVSSDAESLKTSPAALEIIARLRAMPVRCEDVMIVPGGAWALPILSRTLPSIPWYEDPLTQVPIPAMDSALAVCSLNGCLAIGAIAGSAVQISTDSITTMPEFLTYASAKAAEIRAAG